VLKDLGLDFRLYGNDGSGAAIFFHIANRFQTTSNKTEFMVSDGLKVRINRPSETPKPKKE
jgi:2-methylisocitrate dehydratase, Fe/S-dependent